MEDKSRVRLRPLFLISFFCILHCVRPQSTANDASVMQELQRSIGVQGWSGDDPCTNWEGVQCSRDNRISRIQIRYKKLTGSLPVNLGNLTDLQTLDLVGNNLNGPLPSLAGLSSLQNLLLSRNSFSSIPSDFFSGMSSLQEVALDYNPFSSWTLPESLRDASSLKTFSATSANVSGKIPDFFGGENFAGLSSLRLSFNYLEGELPASFSGSSIQTLWLNGQQSTSKLNGGIAVLQNMTQLSQLWLHSNSFSGPLPDFSGLTQLQDFSIRDNSFTGPVPASLVTMPSLKTVNLTNNLLQGPTPRFGPAVSVDNRADTNSFCLPDPGVNCDPRVTQLLDVIQPMGYPKEFSNNWKYNDPCSNGWMGITCINGNITVINLPKKGLTGTVSPKFADIKYLERLILANNNLTGNIPTEFTSLENLKELDLSNNLLYGKIPSFRSNVDVKTTGNVNIGKDTIPATPTLPNSPSGRNNPSSGNSTESSRGGGKKSSATVVAGSVVGGLCAFFIAGILVFFLYRTKRKHSGRVQSPNTVVIHPRHSGSDNDTIKITVAGSSNNGGATSETYSQGSSNAHDLHVVESGNMVISIQILKSVTNNFSEKNILGKGGFGTVYKGELHDGTKIAVKRMESSVVTEKGLNEFKSEIAVLTKVRHRHLVALLGYCLDGNERLLVFEYMPQGTLSQHLFNWSEEGLKPLEWSKRLIIALDVARGVEYLHGLAQQTFIHRDLKPSNILLGDDMRAKVADFGLVRLAPEGGKGSIVTKLAGTFGYLAPEYAATGRVTTKIDVFSFGVILMELITGRKALDDTQNEESTQLVPWFRRMYNSKDTFRKAIDSTLNLDEESMISVGVVAELSFHCTAREPYQRPDMGHAVNVLSSQAELWKPSKMDPEDVYGIDYEVSLPEAIKKWQAMEGMSSYDVTSFSMVGSNDSTQTSIPTRPSGFADSFTSADGR